MLTRTTKLVTSISIFISVQFSANADIAMEYTITNHSSGSTLGQATVLVTDKYLRTDYNFTDDNRSYLTEKWKGRYVIDHSLHNAYLTNYDVMRKHFEPRIKMMAEKMPAKTEAEIYAMTKNPKYDRNEYIIFKNDSDHVLIGHKPGDVTDVRFKVYTQPTNNAVKALNEEEFDWLLTRVNEDVRFGLSGTLLTHQPTELFRRLNYQHDVFPYKVIDIDAGYILELTKLVHMPIEETKVAVNKGYIVEDSTKSRLELMDDIGERLKAQ